nr:hypothetical protein CFP56_07577 [Quercus suber]
MNSNSTSPAGYTSSDSQGNSSERPGSEGTSYLATMRQTGDNQSTSSTASPLCCTSSIYGAVEAEFPSSPCLDEAKRRVRQRPASARSRNYCWLVLDKIQADDLVQVYANMEAAKPEMWGGTIPNVENVRNLEAAFVEEWNAAIAQMLKCFESIHM